MHYNEGIPVGYKLENSAGNVAIYNHLDITVKVHEATGSDALRIVGFEVLPRSIANGAARA